MQVIIKLFAIAGLCSLLSGCSIIENKLTVNNNLINKVNAVDDSWTNYDGHQELNNSMTRSQFIPYDADHDYIVNYPTYISYFNGEVFIKTVLYENTPGKIDKVQEANGVIVSFNKKNKAGMQLVEVES